ncbi:acyl carrier protein phosphodiesterase [Halomonas fontilapidosi]|uniref:Acyl carrier protein phosphodiesterase n=1 Tax=Halomonas fontilapidosi TaxID=616675 RepID=A0A7W5DGM9_9GAMM|nr:ACP phosphodiesterase [Halomonas fontilapidosi]MBB3182560.1 acyl carrier protein phosphodiesterase [Halomonas fontilapidosi]
MNFLAHGWLARGGSDDFLYGNLIADGVKGADLSAWRAEQAAGIRHHRRVDAFVDRHPVVSDVLARAPRRQRRFAGIALDLVWDHFTARTLADDQRRWLTDRCYQVLSTRPAPARLETMVPALVEQDWLNRYADFAFTCRAIEGIGRRLSGPNRLVELLPWLEEDYEQLARDFARLWPAVNDTLGVVPSEGPVSRP